MRRLKPSTSPLADFCGMASPDPAEFRPPWPDGCPEPGIYRGVPFDEYKSWKAVNASSLKAGVDLSPLHMRCAVEEGRDDTAARKFGRAVHCRFLEPEAFAERFLVAEPCSAPLKSGDRKGQPCGVSACRALNGLEGSTNWYCKKHAPPEAVEPDEYIQLDEAERIEKMWAAVTKHPIVEILRAHGGCEVSLVWERDGIPCKARLDKLIEEFENRKLERMHAMLLDLKKVQAWHIGTDSVHRAIQQYHYDLQMFWYCDGYRRLTGKEVHGAWIFGEDGPPYDVRPKWVTPGWLKCGQFDAERAFRKYKAALETGQWQGVSPEFDVEEPSDFYLKTHLAEL